MKIKKGEKFRCIKNIGAGDNIFFCKGYIYKSDKDNYLTSKFDNQEYNADFVVSDYFERVNTIIDNTPDQINPSHYKQYSIEVIEMMRKIWGDESVAIHCELTAFKYRMRAGMKGEFAVCIEKEEWYINKAKELRSTNESQNTL